MLNINKRTQEPKRWERKGERKGEGKEAGWESWFLMVHLHLSNGKGDGSTSNLNLHHFYYLTGLSIHRLSLQILLTWTFWARCWICWIQTVSNDSFYTLFTLSTGKLPWKKIQTALFFLRENLDWWKTWTLIKKN